MKGLERIEYKGLKFDVRPGTSDEKSINEVVIRRGYARRGFAPAEGQTWVDLGANIGAFSVWAAKAGAEVLCYEPDPTHCELIEHNLKLNGLSDQVKVHQVAVVNDDRPTATLHQNVARGNTWRNSIERGWRGETSITVPCVNVAKVWKKKRWIKMDVEGSEMAILEGVGSEVTVQGLVFEWSFDVDPDLNRYRRVMSNLMLMYDEVQNCSMFTGHDVWPPEWFPPCKTIWCW